jgi:hypothetical protein
VASLGHQGDVTQPRSCCECPQALGCEEAIPRSVMDDGGLTEWAVLAALLASDAQFSVELLGLYTPMRYGHVC